MCISCVATLIVAGALLGRSLSCTEPNNRSISHLWSLGFGKVNSETLMHLYSDTYMSKPATVIFTVLLANTPQIILSFLYFTYNGIFTCMLLAEEWSAYGFKKRFLRVTSPSGGQRSTYRLQLPYRYGVPLLIASSVLHWLVSQSIFLARVDVFDPTGFDMDGWDDGGISTCGYSPMAIIFVIFFGFIVLLVGICNGFMELGGMPLAGSCSAAISAACHPPETDVNASLKRVMWGVVDEGRSHDSNECIGHCSFTSFKVESPVVGRLYAGLQKR